MKKIRLIFSAVLMMTAFGFIACSHSASGSNSSSGSNNTGNGNNSKYHVGDIVLNDGNILLSSSDKVNAIAVIYKVDGSKAYGVGLVHNKNGIKWCRESANGYNTNFTDLQCEISGSDGNYSFTGDIDGSDNFTKMAQTLGANDDTEIEGNYPAFEFAKNYKSQTNSHVNGTTYESGWYLPTLAELYDIWKVKGAVAFASGLCEGCQFGEDWYWSSSQDASDERFAYVLDFSNGSYYNPSKFLYTHCNVCCIRVFE